MMGPPSCNMRVRLVLASGSPRRKELLQQLGVQFEVKPVDIDETRLPREAALVYAQRLASEKARAGYRRSCTDGDPCVVLGADTVVVVDDDVLGKPASKRQAVAFLAKLSARTHIVHTAIALVSTTDECVDVVSSEREFARLSERQIKAYVETGEPLDKAGAYAIQGIAGRFVVNLNGSYSGVMGLPLFQTAQLLSARGISCPI